MAQKIAGVIIAQGDTEIVRQLVDDEKDRVIQILARPEATDTETVVINLPSRLVRDANQVVIALPVAGDIVETRHGLKRAQKRRNALRLGGILIQLRRRQAAGEFGIRLRHGNIEAGLQLAVEFPAEVGKETLVVLTAVITIPIRGKMRETHIVVERADHIAAGKLRPVGIETSEFKAGIDQWGVVSGVGNKIQRASKSCGSVFQAIRAAKDLHSLRGQGLDHLKVETSIGKVDWDAILQELESTAVESALNARTTDRDTRLLGTKTRLDEYTRRVIQGIFQCRGASALVGLGIDDLTGSDRFVNLLPAA